MAPSAEASAALNSASVSSASWRISANDDTPWRTDTSVTLQTEVGITFRQHLWINGAMNIVTIDATFAYGLMVEHVWPCLLTMTLRANIIHSSHVHALWIVNILTMRVVATNTAHSPFFERMMIGKIELRFFINMALETCFRIFTWIDDKLTLTAAGIYMETTGTMTAFAALAGNAFLVAGELNSRVLGELEIIDFLFVTSSTNIHADILRTGDKWRSHHHPVNRRAGNCQSQYSASAKSE